ncbi:hypothetical protein GCM10025781_02180 [Kocuria gwangalliensis]|uniref:Uncharacterized protein n=1 Tax=Kocuria gwangalliensis TaxID=501592 RepID=A0ABP8WH10_9MICC
MRRAALGETSRYWDGVSGGGDAWCAEFPLPGTRTPYRGRSVSWGREFSEGSLVVLMVFTPEEEVVGRHIRCGCIQQL